LAHVLLLNLVFFTPATCGAVAFAIVIYRAVLHTDDTVDSDGPGPGGTRRPVQRSAPRDGPSAGPDDLARSA
jgi:hypothetical protein